MHRNWPKISTALLHTHSGNFSLSFLASGLVTWAAKEDKAPTSALLRG